MKEAIHPEYFEATVVCGGCGTTFTTGSTLKEIRIGVCSKCHPFYTGKQRFLDTERRVDKFNKKYGKKATTGASEEATETASADA